MKRFTIYFTVMAIAAVFAFFNSASAGQIEKPTETVRIDPKSHSFCQKIANKFAKHMKKTYKETGVDKKTHFRIAYNFCGTHANELADYQPPARHDGVEPTTKIETWKMN